MGKSLSLILLSVLISACAAGADWPQYLGPDRDATSSETGLLRSWPESGPEVLWTIELGPGYGGAAVKDGKVYILDRIRGKRDIFRCLDLNTGKEIWSYPYDSEGRISHTGSRCTPAIDGDLVYTCGQNGDVYCFNLKTRRPVWNKNVWTDYGGGKLPIWGICQNPLIYKDTVILASQTEQAGVVAYDKKTGEVKWASEALPGEVGYVTPYLIKIDGEDQLVMITATSRRETGGRSVPAGKGPGVDGVTLGMDPDTGKTLWTYKGWQCRIPIPNVVECGDGKLFISGGYQAGSAMIKVSKSASGYKVEELYTTMDFGSHCHPAVLYEGHLYGHCTTNTRRDGMVCMSVDGKLKWKTGQDPVFDKGGFILVDDLILSVDGRDGYVFLIEPGPEGFKPLAKVDLLDTREPWAPLTLADGKLLIRDQEKMKCLVVAK